MSTKRFLLIAVLIWGFGAGELRAQGALGWPEWLQVGWHNNGPGWTAIYFIDPLRGLSAANGGIAYTTPTAPGHWFSSTMPAGIKAINSIRSIQGRLYAASEGTDILVSTDSGKSWQFSGLDLNNANDVYADANGTIRILTDPMTRFARIDTLDCVATGNGSIFRSSDGGLNWTTVVTGNDPMSVGVFGDPCEHVFIAPYSWGTACLRSTDSGQTWKTVLTGASAYPELIYGASTVPYISDSGGLFRSIDDGVTWTSIITVNGGPYEMYVWGPMGEHAVVGFINGEIFMTSTGGDDNLHSAVAMTDSNGAPLEQDDTMNVPFQVVSFCNTFTIPIAMEADVPGLSVKATLTSNHGGDVSILGTGSMYFPQPVLNERYTQDTMWLSYHPRNPVDTALITFNNHWNCSDWTETRSVILISYPEADVTPLPALTGECHPVGGALVVTVDSCSLLVIDSVSIPPELLSRLHLTSPLPDTISSGESDSLFFSFDPSDTVANILDSVQLFAHYPGMDSALAYFDFRGVEGFPTPSLTSITQFYPVKLVAGAPLVTNAPSLNTGPICINDERDTFVVIQNVGCIPITITGATVSSPDFVITGGGGDTVLAPDAYDTIYLQTHIDTTAGALSNNATLTVLSKAPNQLAPIPLTSEIQYPVPWGLHLSPADSAAPGTDVTYQIIQSGKLPANITSIEFTLTYDDDLLRFIRVEERGVDTISYTRTPDGLAHLTIQVSPVVADSIVATLHFYPYVARTTQTNITLNDPSLLDAKGGSENCIASVTTGQTLFTLIPTCGSNTLSGYLQNGRILIDNITPNPASGTILVGVSSGATSITSATLTIMDALGRTVSSNDVILIGGEENHVPLNIENLPSGIYVVRLSGSGLTSTREFVKE
jgi:photosystem II stability/assembly factor-like uncharacterized protein